MDDELKVQFTEGKQNGLVIKLLCAHCRSKNRHTVITSSHEHAEVDGMWFDSYYYIARCNGCDEQRFCTIATSSEDVNYIEDHATGKYDMELEETIKQYPQVDINYAKPQTYFSTPFEVRQVRDETYMALCADAKKLASIGMRTIVETICAVHGITDSTAYTLPEKIEALCERKVIAPGMKEVLLGVKEFGDLGAHTLRLPSTEELNVAWDAIGLLLSYIYGTQDTQERTASMKAFGKRPARAKTK